MFLLQIFALLTVSSITSPVSQVHASEGFPSIGAGAVSKGTVLFVHPTTQETYALSLWQPDMDSRYFNLLLTKLPKSSSDKPVSQSIRGDFGQDCRAEIRTEAKAFDPATGKIYFGCQKEVYSKIVEVDTVAGRISNIFHFSLQAMRSATVGQDQKIYFGSAVNAYTVDARGNSVPIPGDDDGHVVVIDPKGAEAHPRCPGKPVCDLGTAGTFPSVSFGYHYYLAQSGGAGSSSYVYAAMGENPWYLGILDTSTGKQQNFLDANCVPGGGCKLPKIVSGSFQRRGGKLFYVSSGFDAANRRTDLYYRLENGEAILQFKSMTGPSEILELVNGRWVPARLAAVDNLPSSWSVDSDDSEVVGEEPSHSGRDGAFTSVRFKHKDGTVVSQATNVRVVPLEIDRLFAESERSLLMYSRGHRVIERLRLNGNQPEILKRQAFSVYTMQNLDDSSVFIAGYPNVMSILDSRSGEFSNLASPVPAKYFLFSDLNRNRTSPSQPLIYLAGYYERTGTGGVIVWYNPSNQKFGFERDFFVPDPARPDQGQYDPAGMAVGQGRAADFLLYSALSGYNKGVEPRVFAFTRSKLVRSETDRKPLVLGSDYFEIYPIRECQPGTQIRVTDGKPRPLCQAGALISTPSGKFVGTYSYTKQATANTSGVFTKIYVWDAAKRKVIFEQEVLGLSIRNGVNSSSPLSLSPKGEVWFLAGATVQSIDPDAEEIKVQLRATDPRFVGNRELTWMGDRVYTYVGSEIVEIK